MIIFNSKEKDRNYHRSKKKFFKHHDFKNSKEKPTSYGQANNQSNQLNPRDRSPSKDQKKGRSPSKESIKSKKSRFSDKDKYMTKQIIKNAAHYFGSTSDQRNGQIKRQFKSPGFEDRQNQNIRQLRQIRSTDAKLLRRRSKQHQKNEPIRRKQRYTKLFQKLAVSPNYPQRTGPLSPKINFLQQKGQINPISADQAEQLQELRGQNQFYKLVYRASLQKMKRLENNIEKKKNDYKKTRAHFQKQLRQLKYKVERADKKVSIGHLYSYDKKQMLKVSPENIITETDNQASEITDLNDKSKQKDQMPSRLSIEST